MREYTLQWLEDMDWIRVTAIYDDIESVMTHASDLLIDGRVVRLLVRDNESQAWHTSRLNLSGHIALDRQTTAPK